MLFLDNHPLIAARSVPITLSFMDPSTNTLSPVLLDLYPRTMTTLSHAGRSITVGRSRLNTQKMPASRQPWVHSPSFHTSAYGQAQTTRGTNPRNLMSRRIQPTQPRCLFAISTSPISNPAPLHDGAPPHPISTTGQPPHHPPTATKRPWSRAHTPPTPSSGPRNPQPPTPPTRSPRRSAPSPHPSTPAPNPPLPVLGTRRGDPRPLDTQQTGTPSRPAMEEKRGVPEQSTRERNPGQQRDSGAGGHAVGRTPSGTQRPMCPRRRENESAVASGGARARGAGGYRWAERRRAGSDNGGGCSPRRKAPDDGSGRGRWTCAHKGGQRSRTPREQVTVDEGFRTDKKPHGDDNLLNV